MILCVRWAFCLLVILRITAEGSTAARCQSSAAEGTLNGVVVDPSGAKVAHAAIHIEGSADRDLFSDAAGRFSLMLPAGSYTVTVRVPGFKDFTATAQVIPGGSVRLDTKLAIAPVLQ